jgi:hypothetical protein
MQDMGNNTLTASDPDVVDSTAKRRGRREMLRDLQLELLGIYAGGKDRACGVNPYDNKLGCSAEDVWRRLRRA